MLTQRTNSHLIFVTATPDVIFGDGVLFVRYKCDIQRRKSYRDINTFSSFVTIADVRHLASQSTELRIQWEPMSCLLHMNGMNNVEGTQDQEHQDRHVGFWVLINMDRTDLRV